MARGCCIHVFLFIVFAFNVNYGLAKSSRFLQTYWTELNATQGYELMSLSVINNWGKDVTEKKFYVCIVSILNTITQIMQKLPKSCRVQNRLKFQNFGSTRWEIAYFSRFECFLGAAAPMSPYPVRLWANAKIEHAKRHLCVSNLKVHTPTKKPVQHWDVVLGVAEYLCSLFQFYFFLYQVFSTSRSKKV